MQPNNDIPLTERLHRVSRAAILARHALSDLCADYLRIVAVLHKDELTEEQAAAIEEAANLLSGEEKAVNRIISRLDSFFERESINLHPAEQKTSGAPTSQ